MDLDKIDTMEEANVEQTVDLMVNRRKMAFYAFYATVILAVFVIAIWLIKPDVLNTFAKIESILTTIVFGWFTVITLYFGASSVIDAFGKKMNK